MENRWSDNSGFKFEPLPKKYSINKITSLLKDYGLTEKEIEKFFNDLDDIDDEKMNKIFGV